MATPSPSSKTKRAKSSSRKSRITPAIGSFAETTLHLPLYPWQREALEWFDPAASGPRARVKGALCTPNGAGKSERVVASLALWWLAAHPRGKVVITTKDSKQLDNQVFPAIRRHEGKFPDWKFVNRLVTTPAGGRCVLFTTDEPGRAEGWHKEDDTLGPLLIIVDEAKSVPDLIFQAIDRCTYNALLYVSSPGVKDGRFYDVFAKDIGFRAKQVGLQDCPHIPKERIDDIIHQYGEDHPFTLSTLHGEFMDEDGENMFVVAPSAVRQLYENPPEAVDGRHYAFCDFAAGGDENVLAHRTGNKILPLLAWKEANTMATVGRFITEFRKRGLRPGDIYGDEGGLGGPMIDRLAEAGWPINRVNNASSPLDPDRYENRGSEMWHAAAQIIAGGGIILPPDDRLKTQLTTRKIKFLSDSRLGIESKKDMAKRGLASPDRADAVIGVIAIDAELNSAEFDPAGLRRLEKLTRPGTKGLLTPADFGVNWTPRAGGWLEAWELPVYGRAYLAVVKAGADDWSVLILRKGEKQNSISTFDSQLPAFQNDSLVCRINAESTRAWDTPLLADRIELLLRWYGNPVIVPDIRQALDLLDRLREKGASIHRRPSLDRAASASSGNSTASNPALGWETTEKNLPIPIAALARAIREATIDIPDETALRSIRRFNRRTGLDNADTVALGLALHCLDSATVFTAPPRPAWSVTQSHNHAPALAAAGACR